ncbi:MAG: hypothetical protein OXF22_05575 [Anaerolineaceae bacterium]|nr:hypothetical protein [Chloroflexota bacterium]MCY4009203.1 hypothetical protein [Anaerolineaceae bacterium]
MRELHPQLNPDEFAVVGLSVETNLGAANLARYADGNGFNWRFAVMTPDMLAAVVNQYGNQAIVPPRTPHFVISANGTLGPLSLGIKSEGEILAELEASAQSAQ